MLTLAATLVGFVQFVAAGIWYAFAGARWYERLTSRGEMQEYAARRLQEGADADPLRFFAGVPKLVRRALAAIFRRSDDVETEAWRLRTVRRMAIGVVALVLFPIVAATGWWMDRGLEQHARRCDAFVGPLVVLDAALLAFALLGAASDARRWGSGLPVPTKRLILRAASPLGVAFLVWWSVAAVK